MGRKAPNIAERIKIAYNFIRYGRGKVRMMTCEKCGGMIIQSISDHPVTGQWITNTRHVDQMWVDIYRCSLCGAVCQDIQLWNYAGNVHGVDPSVVQRDKTPEESKKQ